MSSIPNILMAVTRCQSSPPSGDFGSGLCNGLMINRYGPSRSSLAYLCACLSVHGTGAVDYRAVQMCPTGAARNAVITTLIRFARCCPKALSIVFSSINCFCSFLLEKWIFINFYLPDRLTYFILISAEFPLGNVSSGKGVCGSVLSVVLNDRQANPPRCLDDFWLAMMPS